MQENPDSVDRSGSSSVMRKFAMLVSDLPEDDCIGDVRIRLPDEVLEEFKDFAGGEAVMYFVGVVMGAFMMSPDPPGGERRLYPMPPGVNPEDILSWEVA